MNTTKKTQQRIRRKRHIRKRLAGTDARPRLNIYRSNKHIYAQVVNDDTGKTLVAASSLTATVRADAGEKDKKGVATLVGTAVGQAAIAAGVTKVVFDRNGFRYHGRVAALADAARKAGLEF